jgi:hypothetical protein
MLLSKEEKIQWKKVLLDVCLATLFSRMDVASSAMQSAQDAANSEDKSSAGDKYETGRAMSQLDRDMNARQFEEAKSALALAEKIPVNQCYDKVVQGAVACTDACAFFLGVGLGIKEVQGREVVFLSSAAPLAMELMGKRKGDFVFFKGKKVLILDVF